MTNDKRITIKWLGVFTMEIVNVTPKEFKQMLIQIVLSVGFLGFVAFMFVLGWRMPEIITAVRWW